MRRNCGGAGAPKGLIDGTGAGNMVTEAELHNRAQKELAMREPYRRLAWAVASLLALSIVQAGASAQPGAGGEAQELRRVPTKPYFQLSPEVIWRAADAGAQANVRFDAAYEGLVPLGRALRVVRLDGQLVPIAAAFGTAGNLTCLVPAGQPDTLEKLGNLAAQQQLTVEGTIIGVIGTYRCVMVDRLIVGKEEESRLEEELELRWPGMRGVAPVVITEPGDHAVDFPCRYVRGQTEGVVVSIEQQPREQFMEQLRRAREAAREETATAEGETGARPPATERSKKSYRLYEPAAVYRLASDAEVRDVQFRDRVNARSNLAPRFVPVPGEGPTEVGYAFDTATGLTCLVRADDEETMAQLGSIIPGLDVTVRGTTLPGVPGLRTVVVDKLEFPGLTPPARPPFVWVVSVYWGEEEPRRFYEPGIYPLQFPCRYNERRRELLEVELREVRVILGETEAGSEGE